MNDQTPTAPVTTIARPARTVGEFLASDAQKNAIAQAMPSHMEASRFMRCLFTALQRTPKLAECTKESVYDAVIRSAQCGLSPDGYEAHLVPYGSKCTFIPDYKGMIKLALQSGLISKFDAELVCENDEFDYDCGTLKRFKRADVHPDKTKRMSRGEIYAVFVICTFKDGTQKMELMSFDDVDAIRKRSKASGGGPWVTDWAEMAKKTVFKRMSKWLPRSAELQQAIEADEDTIEISSPARHVGGVDLSKPLPPAITESMPGDPVPEALSAEEQMRKDGFTK